MGVSAELIQRAHDRGIRWLQTVNDPQAAEIAVAAGADVLIAQGHEAGGNSGWIATMVLVPSVVDVAGDVPVVAAGGIADGRGVAAALALGAQGAVLGTRFLATTEMGIDERWKQRIVAAAATDTVKLSHSELVMPPFTMPQLGVANAPRTLRTPLVDQLEAEPDSIDSSVVVPQLVAALRAGGGHDLLPFTGQSAALIHDIVPTVALIDRLAAETIAALRAIGASLPGTWRSATCDPSRADSP
jgi:nitronate monooxygenase/enoyl-[acyl-carrier protein] reductase II